MKAIIAEDEKILAEDLHRRLARIWPQLEVLAVVQDGMSAVEALRQHAPDIAFLDIRMPGMNGLEVARQAPAGCRIIFVTAYDEYAVAAFEHAAVDYLLKPVNDDRLQRCVNRLKADDTVEQSRMMQMISGLLQREVNSPLRWIRAQQGQSVHMVAVEDVCYFQSDEKYTAVMTRDSEYLVRTPLKELLEQLDAREFWQVHRGTLVNVRQIVSAQSDDTGKLSLNLRDRKEKLAVSRSYAHLFRQM